jgi:hypothetical protein
VQTAHSIPDVFLSFYPQLFSLLPLSSSFPISYSSSPSLPTSSPILLRHHTHVLSSYSSFFVLSFDLSLPPLPLFAVSFSSSPPLLPLSRPVYSPSSPSFSSLPFSLSLTFLLLLLLCFSFLHPLLSSFALSSFFVSPYSPSPSPFPSSRPLLFSFGFNSSFFLFSYFSFILSALYYPKTFRTLLRDVLFFALANVCIF